MQAELRAYVEGQADDRVYGISRIYDLTVKKILMFGRLRTQSE
jgi:hypothetical protein